MHAYSYEYALVLQASFYDDLAAFLETPLGSLYSGDIVFYNPEALSEGIKTTRIGARQEFLDNSREEVDSMDSIRSTLSDLPPPLGTNAFAFGSTFLQTEGYKEVGREVRPSASCGFLWCSQAVTAQCRDSAGLQACSNSGPTSYFAMGKPGPYE